MVAAGGAFAPLRFSTRDLPPGARLPALRRLFEDVVRLDVRTEPGHAVEMSLQRWPGLRRARMLSPLTARMERPRSRLADGEDSVCLMIKASGDLRVAQGGREGVPRTGDGVLLVYREPAALDFAATTYLSVRVPFQAVAALADVEAAAAACLHREVEALSLLKAYVAALPDDLSDPRLGRLAAAHVCDLIALALGATAEGRAQALGRGVRAGRLAAIKRDMAEDATQPIDVVAARRGISPRYVQMLFEEAGTTFTRHALDLRLDAARRLLTSPRHAGGSITRIAFEAGFNDLSHFNRSFKRRFSMTPSELRHGSGTADDAS